MNQPISNPPIPLGVTELHAVLGLLPSSRFPMSCLDTSDSTVFGTWLIHHGYVHLPVSSVLHEKSLLIATSDPDMCCMRGTACLGAAGLIIDTTTGTYPTGRILQQYLTPREYMVWTKDHVRPSARRLCILCTRDVMCEAICLLQAMNTTVEIPENIILQTFRNLVNTEGGYCVDSTLMATGRVKLLFPYPVVCFQPRRLHWEDTTLADGQIQWSLMQNAIEFV